MQKIKNIVGFSFVAFIVGLIGMIWTMPAQASIFFQDENFSFSVGSSSSQEYGTYVSGNISMKNGTVRGSYISVNPVYVYDATTKTYIPSKTDFDLWMNFSGDYKTPVMKPSEGQILDINRKGLRLYESATLSTYNGNDDGGGKGAAPIDAGDVALAATPMPIWSSGSAHLDSMNFILNGTSYGRYSEYASQMNGPLDSWSAYISTPLKLNGNVSFNPGDLKGVMIGEVVQVPEPTSLALVGLGAIGLIGRRRRA